MSDAIIRRPLMLAEDDTPTGEYAYTGEFTPTERKAVYTFKAPGCTYIACRFIGTPDMTTGKAFVRVFRQCRYFPRTLHKGSNFVMESGVLV